MLEVRITVLRSGDQIEVRLGGAIAARRLPQAGLLGNIPLMDRDMSNVFTHIGKIKAFLILRNLLPRSVDPVSQPTATSKFSTNPSIR